MTTLHQWTASDLRDASYVGILEFQDNGGEWHNFEVLTNTDRLIFGGSTNTGFLESGFMRHVDGEFIDDSLRELLADLEAYYNDGPQYCLRIVCNERM